MNFAIPHQGEKLKRTRPSRIYRWVLSISELLIAMSLVTIVFVRVMLFQFATLGAIYFPLVLAAFGFASLLYNRSRAYTRGRGRVRSLYAAERATQGVFFLLIAGVLAGGLYTVFVYWVLSPSL